MKLMTTTCLAVISFSLITSTPTGAQSSRSVSNTLPGAFWLDKLSAAERRKVEARYASLTASIDKYEQTAAALKDSIGKSLEALPPKERELFISRLEQRASAARLKARQETSSRSATDEKRFAADFEAAEKWYAALTEAERARVDGRYATYSALMLDFHRTSESFRAKIDALMKNAPAQEKTLFAGRVRKQIRAE